MLLLVLACMLEPDAARPQLVLQCMYDACQRVWLPQQAHLTKQVLIYGAACHQGQHLTRHTKRLCHGATQSLI